MISASEFRNGITVSYEGNIFTIIEFQHVKPGKGAAFVRTKLRNIINGGVIDKTFRPNEKMERAHIERKDMQYLYLDSGIYNFMDPESFEQTAVDAADAEDSMKYVKENDMVKILSYNGNIFGIEPETNVELEVIDTEPGFKGDTATGANKPAKLETGASVNVPLFINIGDKVKIDTRTGDYVGRV